jgi:serine/threonine-protein kinase RsbW
VLTQNEIEQNVTETIKLELPANLKYLNVLGACLVQMLMRVEGMGTPEEIAQQVELAVHEVYTNIISHAYADKPSESIQATFKLMQSPRQIVIEIYDNGANFDLANVKNPDLENGQVHGYGLFIARSLMDDLTYQAQLGGNYWRLVKYLN